MEDRIYKIKRQVEAMMDAGVRRTTFYPLIAESLKETEGQPKQIRRARAMEYLLDNVELEVFPHELLGGSILGMWPVEPVHREYSDLLIQAEQFVEEYINPPEEAQEPVHFYGRGRNAETSVYGAAPMGKSRFALMARDHYDANVDYLTLQKLIKETQSKYEDDDRIEGYEIARVLENRFQFDYGEDVMKRVLGLPWMAANHLNLNYGRAINTGYAAVLEQIKNLLEESKDDPEKQEFYTACKIVIEAAIRYMKRYAKAYLGAAKTEEDPVRSEELREIAEIIDKVSTEKPETFREAIQLVWLTHLIANTGLGSALSFAKFDQYMYPFYRRDIELGRITFDEARDLVCMLYLKCNEPKMRTVQSMALGGLDAKGESTANEFTKVCLAAARVTRLPYPNISLQVSPTKSPEWVMDEAMETIKLGFGMPQLYNADAWMKVFLDLGHSPENACNYYNMGCVETLIADGSAGWLIVPNGFISYSQLLDEILDEYRAGKVRIESFDELIELMLERIRIAVGQRKVSADYRFMHTRGYDAFGSVWIDGCLEKGKDMFQGGAAIPGHIPLTGSGLANTADSLATIKTLVFDSGRYCLDQLIDIVRADYEGQEPLRRYIKESIPHYGNDIEWVDDLAAQMFNTFTYAVNDLNDGTLQEKYVNSFFSYTQATSLGEVTGATLDGRKKGQPISDGLGPVQGHDTHGPTHLLNSLLKLDYKYLNGALATNLKVTASLFSTKGGVAALKSLLMTYLERGGPQIQINFVKPEELIEAKKNPYAYRNLVVRIAGFCEYFIYLDDKMQDEIISRTAYSTA
ncbi:MAG: pyruvate formate lyase [Clostridiales bacterium]|jgi:pyruvate-formate lyase|nr:pyruvate formate lyase [Clostridiales bacterium]